MYDVDLWESRVSINDNYRRYSPVGVHRNQCEQYAMELVAKETFLMDLAGFLDHSLDRLGNSITNSRLADRSWGTKPFLRVIALS